MKAKISITAGFLLGGALLFLAFRDIDFGRLVEIYSEVNPWYIIPFVLTILLEMLFRSARWRLLLNPASKEEVPVGSILVYDRGWCGFSESSGHIEVLTAPDWACSDGCESLDNNCFADASIREHVHVIIPVKN